MHTTNRPQHLPHSARARLASLVAVGALAIAACGGGSDTGSADVPGEAAGDTPTLDGLDTSGLDAGQEDILDDVVEDLGDEFSDDGDEAAAAWAGIRLVSSWGDARLEVLDADQFSGVLDVFSTPIPDGLFNPGNIDNSVIVGETMWVSATNALSRVSLADGAVTATISIDDVLPGGEFGGMTGDADGVYVLATIVGGTDVIADIDPSAGTVRGTIDLTDATTSLSTITSNATHVAASYEGASGIPVKLIERSTGVVTDVGNYLQLNEPHIVRNELWVIVGSGKTSVPDTYEKFSLDGSPIGAGTLPGSDRSRCSAIASSSSRTTTPPTRRTRSPRSKSSRRARRSSRSCPPGRCCSAPTPRSMGSPCRQAVAA